MPDEDGSSSCTSSCHTARATSPSWAEEWPQGEIPADLAAVRSVVETLLADVESLARMSPLEHLAWAKALPECSEPEAPLALRAAMARV